MKPFNLSEKWVLFIYTCILITGCEKDVAITNPEKIIGAENTPIISSYLCNNASLSVFFHENTMYLSSWESLYQLDIATSTYSLIDLPFEGLHAITYNPISECFYGVDSERGTLVKFDPKKKSYLSEISSIANTQLERPHDVLFDNSSNWMYVLDANNGNVFRMGGERNEEQKIMISSQHPDQEYYRALSLINGIVHVTLSSSGEVAEIRDFINEEVFFHKSFGKKKIQQYGSWESTGLILNDIEFYNGWFYASNFFDHNYDKESKSINANKLIRFKTWEQFESGEWEDLSSSFTDTLIPYYFTRHDNKLFLATFPGGDKWIKSCVYIIED